MPSGAGGDRGRRRRNGAPGATASSAAASRPVASIRRPLGVRIGHALGITSPRRAAILLAVLCAMALSTAVPLRNYLTQRSELAAVREQQEILTDQVAELERRRALLEDPRHVEAQARERLRYVRPGETPYVVQLPPPPPDPGAGADVQADDPWFTTLWETIVGD
jgi:cell division protein FtsB